MIKVLFVILLHVKIQHKTINLMFCVIYVWIKLPQHDIPQKQLLWRVETLRIIGQKSVTADT